MEFIMKTFENLIKSVNENVQLSNKDLFRLNFIKDKLLEQQKYTSAITSMNSKFLPKSSKMIDFELYRGGVGLDYGAGKFDNYIEFLRETYDITLLPYDPYNRTPEENNKAIKFNDYDFVMCNNVLNVISEDSIVRDITNLIASKKCDAYYLIYEGDKSNVGVETRKDSYQRNAIVKSYLQFIPTDKYSDVSIYRNMIVCKI
jgi:hypothetical protein